MSLINISTIVHFALYKKRVLQHYSILFNAMRVTHLKVSSLKLKFLKTIIGIQKTHLATIFN